MMVHHFLMTYLILEQGQAESFLKIYNDNKTVETEKFHLDVEISYKDES